MMKLENFVGMMTGHFDNKDQFDKMQEEGKTYPYAKHINTACNDKIKNLPENFNGTFVVEESYYKTDEFNFVNRIDKSTSGLVIGAKSFSYFRK